MTHRLYTRIFHTLLLFVLLALLLASLAGHLLLSQVVRTHLGAHLESRAAALAAELPGPDRPEGELQATLERVAEARRVHAAVWSSDGRRLAFTSTDLPTPPRETSPPTLLRSPAGATLIVTLADGRLLEVQPRRFPRPAGFVGVVVLLALLLALVSYPVARLVTRRLEALEAGVRRLGEGDLGARVEVSGEDELSSLAASFNRTAERLQSLVETQRRVLASASHELRSPLARARLALELARDEPAGAGGRIGEVVTELEELDSLVEELLLAGRLELQPAPRAGEPVDLAALVTAEAGRTGATVSSRPVSLVADARALRVLVRNLLENARHHGLGSPVEACVEPLGDDEGGARLWVADRGPGVPVGEADKIFEPFYRPPGHAEGRDGGVGLGLYLVRRIARASGGDATCRPREGGGTLFEVVLREPRAKLGPTNG